MKERPLKVPEAFLTSRDDHTTEIIRLASLGLLSSAIMHEIRNSLTIILGNVQMVTIREGIVAPSELKLRLDRISNQLNKIEGTISRAGSFRGRAAGLSQQADPDAIVVNAIFAFEHLQLIKDSTIHSRYCSTRRSVRCDLSLLEFVVVEILKAAYIGGDFEKISIVTNDLGDRWECRIERLRTTGNLKTVAIDTLAEENNGLTIAAVAMASLGGELRQYENAELAGWVIELPYDTNPTINPVTL